MEIIDYPVYSEKIEPFDDKDEYFPLIETIMNRFLYEARYPDGFFYVKLTSPTSTLNVFEYFRQYAMDNFVLDARESIEAIDDDYVYDVLLLSECIGLKTPHFIRNPPDEIDEPLLDDCRSTVNTLTEYTFRLDEIKEEKEPDQQRTIDGLVSLINYARFLYLLFITYGDYLIENPNEHRRMNITRNGRPYDVTRESLSWVLHINIEKNPVHRERLHKMLRDESTDRQANTYPMRPYYEYEPRNYDESYELFMNQLRNLAQEVRVPGSIGLFHYDLREQTNPMAEIVIDMREHFTRESRDIYNPGLLVTFL